MTGARTTSRGRAISEGKRRHGESLRGEKTAEYRTWCSMHRRCSNPSQGNFKDYGAKGIRVCPEWTGKGGYERFLVEVGRKPTPSHSIDRIDSSKGYEPGNCRWSTMVEQQSNRSSNHVIEVHGERMLLKDWARRLGCSHTTIINRLSRGWSVERAVTTPPLPIGRWAHKRAAAAAALALCALLLSLPERPTPRPVPAAEVRS